MGTLVSNASIVPTPGVRAKHRSLKATVAPGFLANLSRLPGSVTISLLFQALTRLGRVRNKR